MKPKDQILTRMYMVLTLLSIVPVVVAAQMGWIVIAEQDELRARAKAQARSTVEIPAMRGSILDSSGRALATNTARYELALDPTVQGFQARAASFYEKLASITDRTAADYRAAVQDRYSPEYVPLSDGLTERQYEQVRGWDVPGVILTPRFARRYMHGTTAAHVLGHVGGDGHGLAGLELRYDDVLSGTPGTRIVKRDRRGRIEAFVGGQKKKPDHGDDLVLTIDLVRQAALEDELRRGVRESKAAWATAVAMDPETGAVLAMANVPTYNPNRPGAAPDAARRNRAITDRFEPGSTFKLVGATAVVDQGKVAMDDSVETGEGWAVFHGHTMKDVRAHGTISFSEVLSKSSNVGMAKTVQQHLEPGTFYQYARNMGFNMPTGIDLPGEQKGVLKTPDAWSQTTLTSMSIGYEVAVTPLQLVTAYSALANGGRLLKPYVVAERRSVTGETKWTNETEVIRRVMSKETARTLRPAFEAAVESGTATEAQIEGLRVAGKTGTALQVTDGHYTKKQARASFVGFFPADDPKVTLLVIVGAPKTSIYGGAVAAPIFRRVARRWAGTFPSVVDRMTAEATADRPAPPVDSLVRRPALPAGTIGTLPDLTGTSTRRALHWLRRRGVGVRLYGRGVVRDQTPRPGAPVPSRVLLESGS
ncbi:MAG: penicillin-binding transpeptidase domain-containing protein [Salinibacter sp.]